MSSSLTLGKNRRIIMTVGWKDIEDAEIISNWRKEKMEIVVNGVQ